MYEQQQKLLASMEVEIGLHGDTKAHETYLRRLIFGFSVGQKETLKQISEELNVEELENLLEGGTGVENMLYLAHYLEQYISTAKKKGIDTSLGNQSVNYKQI